MTEGIDLGQAPTSHTLYQQRSCKENCFIVFGENPRGTGERTAPGHRSRELCEAHGAPTPEDWETWGTHPLARYTVGGCEGYSVPQAAGRKQLFSSPELSHNSA